MRFVCICIHRQAPDGDWVMWVGSQRHGEYARDDYAILDARDIAGDILLVDAECVVTGEIQRDTTERFLFYGLRRNN